MQRCVCRPKSDQGHACLHSDTLQNMFVHMMPKFMRKHGFDFVRRVVVEKRIGQNDPASVAQSGKCSVRFLAFLGKSPFIYATHLRTGPLTQSHQPELQFFILQWLKLVEDWEQHDWSQLSN